MSAQTADKKVAIVTVAGSQHLVSPGQKITVNRLKEAPEQTLSVASLLDQTPVILKVISHTLGKKINGLKFKNKIRYIKHYGHRQHQTVLEVLSVGSSKIEPKSAPGSNAPEPAVKSETPKADAAVTTKRPTVKKVTKAPKVAKKAANG